MPRYGLGNYVRKRPAKPPSPTERQLLDNLSRGGRRLIGFSRTNLFKRLESSGYAFLLSVQRHILRNFIFIHALDNGLSLPIGSQGAEMLDTRFEDEDAEDVAYSAADLFDDDSDEATTGGAAPGEQFRPPLNEADYRAEAARVYQQYAATLKRRFKWLPATLFEPSLRRDLLADAQALLGVLAAAGPWSAARDEKLNALVAVLRQQHGDDKVLIFSQFADTVDYLAAQLARRGLPAVAGVTGTADNPTALAWRFSPTSNNKRAAIAPDRELRVLVATDVLSEGQNLQDAHVVVNFDLPWAIIRLIQRVGRVDRIGQQSPEILSYTFWPAEGVERLIHLRNRLRRRLRQNQEVVGSDEAFFEDDDGQAVVDLYHERPGVLDEEPDGEVDLVSFAYQIWQNATDADPDLKRQVERLPSVVYAAKAHDAPAENGPPGALVFLRTAGGQNALAWVDEAGRSVTESQFAILRAARCAADTPPRPRAGNHHDLVRAATDHILSERREAAGGQLGRPSGARFKSYERLKAYVERQQGRLWQNHPTTQTLARAIEQIYQYPLRESAREKINRQMRSEASDDQLAELVISLYEEDELCLVQEATAGGEAQIICSLGLVPRPTKATP